MKNRLPQARGTTRDSAIERRRRLRSGAIAEFLAAGYLMLKGYRILARRHRTPYGEVDIIAVRRGRAGRLAFVEVKRRATMAEAEASLTPRQGARIARAADHWLQHRPSHRDRDVGLDAVLIVPGHMPRHLLNVLDAGRA
ncbi:MAG: YraN family protein [Hyphomicrobiaceae bacterium]